MQINTNIHSGMPRQRKSVFGTHAQLAHVWAQQDIAYGRSNDGRMFFEGPSIFSYGHHYCIARFITNRRGEHGVLFNSRGYSVSTAKHKNHVWGAISGVPVFEVPDPQNNPDNKATRKRLEDALESAILRAARSRTNTEWNMRDAEGIAERGNALAEFMGWRWRLRKPDWSQECFAKARERAAKAAAKQAAETKRRNEERAKEAAKKITEWRNGQHAAHLWSYAGPIMLRVNGDVIETSMGGRVPLAHAKRLWPAIKQAKATQTAWHANGHTIAIGHFRVESISAEGTLKVGCHTIAFDELERMARELGLEQAP